MLPFIGVLSVAVPLVVAFLLFRKKGEGTLLPEIYFLPALNAGINSTVALLLIMGFRFIRRGKRELHRSSMVAALILSIAFLISYILYHYGSESVKFHGTGLLKVFYACILFSHILLSVAVVPLALITLYRGFGEKFPEHKKIARWTFPIWLYVSVTGVIVYFMAHVFNPIQP